MQNSIRTSHILSLVLLYPFGMCAQSGSLDTTFDPGSGIDSTRSIYSIALQTNGAIVVVGDFSSFNGIVRTNVARLTPNGGLDASFDPGVAVGSSFSYLNSVVLQPGGEVLIGGSFSGLASTNLARLDLSGGPDTHFSFESDDTVNSLLVQTNGNIILGGFFTQVDGSTRTNLAHLSQDGVLDPTFNPVLIGYPFSSIFALALQPDGKIVIGGSFTNISGTDTTNIARLNSDGTLDTTFKPVAVAGGQLSPAVFYALAVDGRGRVLAGGDFTSVNGSVRTNLVRLNPDGSLDTTFNPAAGADSAINSLVVQSNGQLLLGGYFTLVNGVPRNYVARLNADGSLDTSFDPGTGPDAVVNVIALQPDGKVLIGGSFSTYSGVPRTGIARLNNVITTPPPELLNPLLSNEVFSVSVDTLSGQNYVLEFKNSLADTNWTALPPVSGDGTLKTLSDLSATSPQRFYRVQVK